MNANGCDTARYQHPIDAKLGYSRGLRFAVHRASIGDYYSDSTLRDAWKAYKDAGFLVTAYLVVAPREPACTRRIGAQAHLERFFNTVSGLEPDLPWVVDSELNRNETKEYITELTKDVVTGLFKAQEKFPIIYTRQSWWDYYINPDTLWGQCDLFAARYSAYLTSPWSDGAYKFRDWKDWKFWQYTSHCDGKYYGFSSLDGDLDYFNGDQAALYTYAGKPQPLSKLEILWREAEKAGWNLAP